VCVCVCIYIYIYIYIYDISRLRVNGIGRFITVFTKNPPQEPILNRISPVDGLFL